MQLATKYTNKYSFTCRCP
uniref:Uncharacterized protein n=1 Tax=Anguilla anguilla TaxID=7936 RepID=A0A0E9T1S3_ANGAN